MTSHRRGALDRLVDLVSWRQPACGGTLVVAVDGPSGAGKTDLSEALARATRGHLLQLEDVYPGWHGLERTPPMIAAALESIAVGEMGSVQRWDWVEDRPGSELPVPPAPLLILDGVGSGAAVIRPYLSVLVWVEAPADVRKRRALARDGETYAPFWEVWAEQEWGHFVAQQTRGHADVIVRTGA